MIQGAGGMQMIDPLYQRILVRECKYRKIPVIFDEVFSGFWRLGREVSWSQYFQFQYPFAFHHPVRLVSHKNLFSLQQKCFTVSQILPVLRS